MANGFTNHITLRLLKPGSDALQGRNGGFIQGERHFNCNAETLRSAGSGERECQFLITPNTHIGCGFS